ncbi:hypothetical protein CW749_07335 [Vibrio sp. vnigr-6D03]|uniref:acyltransferase family protein n=1 Tax=Vibrio sp. vnigr-6D03 TaxID=2058088 RepID=UPI000C322484|nr:hypothetical protein CW749_07335 [Vibrio sp. vnigr-6D03]
MVFVRYDVSLLLRAFSIFAIVAGHFDFANLLGGALYLICLSGFNFIKFTVPKFNLGTFHSKNEEVGHCLTTYSRFLIKIIIPTCLYLLLINVLLGRFHPYSILLVSNYIGPSYADGVTVWFIEVLIQIYILFALFLLFAPIRRWMKASPYLLFLCLTIVTYIVSMVSMWKFDTSDLLHRLPHLMLYLFCLGALVANSKTTIQKSLASVLVLGICTPNLISSFGDNMTFLFIAMQITIWLPAIRVPAPLGKLITLVAMSSLFIYLSHFQAKSLLEKVIHNPSPELSVVFALLVGIILSHLWRSRGKALQQFNFARST